MINIAKSSIIPDTVIIHDGVIIEENVVLHDYVVVYSGTIIKKGTEIFEHAVIGKIPRTSGVTAREIKPKFKETIIGEYSVLSPGVVIYAGTEIGSKNLLGDFCSIREDCKTGFGCLISSNVSVNYNTMI